MKQIIITLFYLLPFFAGFSQQDFKPAYVITRQNDTLFGKIDNQSILLLSKSCIFLSGEGIRTKYTPDDIRAFRFIDGSFFIAKDIADEKLFLEFLVKGKINLYYYYDGTDRYFIEKENEPLAEIGGGKTYTKHFGTLNYYTQDAPNLRKKINEIEELNHNNMIALVQDYHNMVCDDEKCIVYVKKGYERKEYQVQEFKNIVGISPFKFIMLSLRVKYERIFNEKNTFGITLTSYYIRDIYMSGGVQLGLFERFYITAPKGWYGQLKLVGGIYNTTHGFVDNEYKTRTESFTSFGGGVACGYQVLSKNNRWVIDINIGLKWVTGDSCMPLKEGEYFPSEHRHWDWWFGGGCPIDGLISIGYRF